MCQNKVDIKYFVNWYLYLNIFICRIVRKIMFYVKKIYVPFKKNEAYFEIFFISGDVKKIAK